MQLPPHLPVVDTWTGATLSATNWGTITGAADPGKLTSSHWRPKSAYPSESGGVWLPGAAVAPGAAAELEKLPSLERYLGLGVCLSTTERAGYFGRITELEAAEHFAVALTRVRGGVTTTLASAESVYELGDWLAVTAVEGRVTVWRKHGGTWTAVVSAADSTFASGYGGVIGAGTAGGLVNFSFGVAAQPYGERLSARLEPWLTGDLERMARAVAAPFEPILALCEEQGLDGEAAYVPPWGAVFNAATCPPAALGYLAQYVGVSLPTTASEVEQRELIKQHPGFERGTLVALEEQIYKHTKLARIEGSSLVERGIIIERRSSTGAENAYEVLIAVPAAEIVSEAELNQGIGEVIPAGIFSSLSTGEKYTFAEALHTYEEDTMTFAETTVKQP